MSRVGRIVFALEAIVFAGLTRLFVPDIEYGIKLIVIYLILQFVVGHYSNKALLVWDGIKMLIKSHFLFLCISLLMLPSLQMAGRMAGKLLGMTAIAMLLSLIVDRECRILFRPVFKHNTGIIGVGDTARVLSDTCMGNRYALTDIRAFFDCNDIPDFKVRQANKLTERQQKITYSFAELDRVLKQEKIDTLIIAIPEMGKSDENKLYRQIYDKVKTVKMVPLTPGSVNFDTRVQDLDGLLLLSTSNAGPGIIARAIKRLLDIIVGLIGTILLLPITLAVWIYNRKQGVDGPVFFVQDRIGQNGKIFKLIKYRSMVKDADKILDEILAKNPDAAREYAETKKLKDDPRITKAGHFLRKTSLDEFPQMINVLKGDMSLVGPRPYLPREKEDMGDSYKLIVVSKPGITGMWQTHGRSDVNFSERLHMDEYYARNWSMWLDVTILIKTVKVVFARGGAV